ncbi:MAG: hypothetical protein ACD_20C00228G0006 [uncultured bacterium]|nr:MAG: hypothetical protein ACD_20C00228G0006 [uncultured bacterium]
MTKKIALCLYGKYNNRYSLNSGDDGTQYIKDNILKGRKIDVFAYSTDLENEEKIRKNYKDYFKSAVFEPQKTFAEEIEENKIDENLFNPAGGQVFRTVANSLSFFYSRKKSIELKQQYEKENNFKYDIVIVCRFDLGQIDKYNGYQPYKVSEINFNEHFDMNFIYSAMWNQMNCGYADQWFYSNSENIDTLALLYEKSLQYFKKDSTYIKAITGGLMDSDADDEFSNEFFRPEEFKSKNFVKYDISQAINNHLMHKWFFIDVGLYEKSKYASNIDNIANILYTHTDCTDVWPAYFGQMEKLFNAFSNNYVFVNKNSDKIPKYYTQIIYDDTKPYAQRILDCFKQVNGFEICFFAHEDMFLYSFPKMGKIRKYVEAMDLKEGIFCKRNKFDFIKMIKGGDFISKPTDIDETLFVLDLKSNWIFSIQPSFWNIKRFVEFLNYHKTQNIWEFEEAAQETCKKMRIRGAYSFGQGEKRGMYHWDNDVYPYIATAIVKGKWSIEEYGDRLQKILDEHGIDVHQRGIYKY